MYTCLTQAVPHFRALPNTSNKRGKVGEQNCIRSSAYFSNNSLFKSNGDTINNPCNAKKTRSFHYTQVNKKKERKYRDCRKNTGDKIWDVSEEQETLTKGRHIRITFDCKIIIKALYRCALSHSTNISVCS